MVIQFSIISYIFGVICTYLYFKYKNRDIDKSKKRSTKGVKKKEQVENKKPRIVIIDDEELHKREVEENDRLRN